jgi:AraC family transcriptional regulator
VNVGGAEAQPVLQLAAGAFFGSPNRSIRTDSFQFSELDATIPEREVPRHTHETPHFILVLRGIYSTAACEKGDLYSASTLIFNPAGTTHRDCFLSPRGKFLSISPTGDGTRLLNRDLSRPQVIVGATDCATDMRIVGQIMREFQRHGYPSAVVLEGLGLELIGRLVPRPYSRDSRCVPDWLARTVEKIEDCAEHDLTISELATTAAVHPVYLARAFRKYFGQSPGEYLRRKRLRYVQRLLSETRHPLVSVALQSGFSDQSRMTNAFTSQFGIPPGRYRRLYGR